MAQNKRIESVRDEMQQRLEGKKSFQKHIFDLERIKKEERELSLEVAKMANAPDRESAVAKLLAEFSMEALQRSKSEMRTKNTCGSTLEGTEKQVDMSQMRINLTNLANVENQSFIH